MNVKEIYKIAIEISVKVAVFNQKGIIEKMQQFVPRLKFLNEYIFENNYYNLEKNDWCKLQKLYLDIIKDILNGLKNRDVILLMDTLENGLIPFLEIFLEDTEIRKIKEESRIELQNL